MVQHNLAVCLAENGEFQEAIDLLRQIESLYLKEFPPDNPGLLIVQNSLAHCLRLSREYKAAMEILRDVDSGTPHALQRWYVESCKRNEEISHLGG